MISPLNTDTFLLGFFYTNIMIIELQEIYTSAIH